jgi:hypothetical protein
VKRHLIALVGALAVLLALGSGVAQAQGVQGVGQTAVTGQSATSNATSTQTNPSNNNIDVRIFSPGSGGSVSQSNTSAAGSAAINAAKTIQGASQNQSGAGEQGVGQSAGTGQHADSSATSTQDHPTNNNIDVRIFSPGSGGDVKQSNTSVAGSLAANAAATVQGVEQNQGGGGGGGKDHPCGCHGGGGNGVQAVGQDAGTLQGAHSQATSTQQHPTNNNIPVRIGSPGSDGSVTQSNSSTAVSAAGNLAGTLQGVSQNQGGGCGCGGGGNKVQAVGQQAFTGQWADSSADSTQKGASNNNIPVRIKSPNDVGKDHKTMGGDGSVDQSNDSTALSGAINVAGTLQGVEQNQGGGDCKCRELKGDWGGGGNAVQAVGQKAVTLQGAMSTANSLQWKPTNTNAPVRDQWSPGGNGSVSQSNASLAASLAANLAGTAQLVRQNQ